MSKIVDYDAWQKLQLAPLTDFNPAVLQGLKYSQHSGYLLELERLYSTMYLEWPTLKKDASDMTEAVAGLTWTVAPFCQDGAEPDDEAKAVAKTVSDALWMVSPQRPGEFSHCFPELLGAMVHAIYRSVNVHEVVWKFTPELVYPLEYKQLGPQYYMWETRQGEPDRLMLVPDGMDYTRPVAFEPGRFVVALNTTGPDHPMYNADFYSLVGYFVAAKFGLPGLQSFVKRYGHPLRKFTIENKTRRQELEAKLRSMPDVYDVFLGPGETLDVTAIPAGANVPHEVLLRVAENACHQLIKGNTLTSDVGDSGGSRAQAEVHMGVEASLVRKRGEFVARVLNRQLIPYIVERNYGRRDLPMPELRCQVPEQKANIQKAQYWQAVLGIPGMRVLKSAVHDDLGIAVPGDGDDVYEGASAAAPAELRRDESAAPDGGMLSMGDDALDVTMAGRVSAGGSLRERVERMLPEAMRRWAGPSIERFERLVRDGRKPEEILARLEELRPDTKVLVQALRAATAAAAGASDEDAQAENPYGCNQYGEGWSNPHDGNSTERVGKAKLLTHKDGDGNVRQIDTKKRYPGKGSYIGVGKDEKKGEEPKPEPKPEPKKKEKPEKKPEPDDKQKMVDEMRFDSPFVSADLEKTVGKEAADKFFEKMAAAPPEIREFWQRNKGFIRRIERITRGVSHESNGIISINRQDMAQTYWSHEGSVLFHEFAHALDESMSRGMPLDMSRKVWFQQKISHEMHDAIAQDYEAQIKLKTEDILNEAKAQLDRHGGKVTDALLDELVSEGKMSDYTRAVYKRDNGNDYVLPDAIRAALGMTERNGKKVKISKGVAGNRLALEINDNPMVMGVICDAFRGKPGCKPIRVGHNDSYYKNWGGNADAVETFANLYAAYALCDEKTLEKVKKYLPETCKVFNNLLRKGA